MPPVRRDLIGSPNPRRAAPIGMDDQDNSTRGKSDHWDLLASTLGATPAPEGLERPAGVEPPGQAPPVEPPAEKPGFPSDEGEPPALTQAELVVGPEPSAGPAAEPLSAVSEEIVSESAEGSGPAGPQDLLASLPQSTFVPPRPERQKTPQDWARLASQLGVELPPEAFQPVQATAETTLEVTPRPSIVVTTLETGPLSPAGRPRSGPTEETPASRGRRKHRRKSPPSDSAAFGESLHEPEESEATAPAQADATGDDLDDLLLLPEESEETPDWAESADSSTAAEGAASRVQPESPPGSTRSKRRRRRKKKPGASIPETPEAALAQARERVESIEDRAFDADAHLAESADSHLAEQSDAEEPDDDKTGIHRSIPTWEEAVGIIISANLEARTKNPDRRLPYSPRNRNR